MYASVTPDRGNAALTYSVLLKIYLLTATVLLSGNNLVLDYVYSDLPGTWYDVTSVLLDYQVHTTVQVDNVGNRSRPKDYTNTSRCGTGGCTSCLLYTSPSPRDGLLSRMPSSA